MIQCGMWDVFNLPDPCNHTLIWDLFWNQGHFPMTYVIKTVKEIKEDQSKTTGLFSKTMTTVENILGIPCPMIFSPKF